MFVSIFETLSLVYAPVRIVSYRLDTKQTLKSASDKVGGAQQSHLLPLQETSPGRWKKMF